MKIILIAAMAKNRVIGKGNAIPWKIPGEQARFKKTTMGHALVMGRKTHESIGGPLPGRKNVVVSRRPDYAAPGCLVAHGLTQAIDLCRNDDLVFIAGGAQIYKQALPLADVLLLTILDRDVEGDAFFPEFSTKIFRPTATEQVRDPEPYRLVRYERIRGQSTG